MSVLGGLLGTCHTVIPLGKASICDLHIISNIFGCCTCLFKGLSRITCTGELLRKPLLDCVQPVALELGVLVLNIRVHGKSDTNTYIDLRR